MFQVTFSPVGMGSVASENEITQEGEQHEDHKEELAGEEESPRGAEKKRL